MLSVSVTTAKRLRSISRNAAGWASKSYPRHQLQGLDFTIEPQEAACHVKPVDSTKTESHNLSIRFGLGAIKNIVEGPIETILQARNRLVLS